MISPPNLTTVVNIIMTIGNHKLRIFNSRRHQIMFVILAIIIKYQLLRIYVGRKSMYSTAQKDV